MQRYNYIDSAWEKKSSGIDGRSGLPVSLRFLCWTVENVFTAAVFM